MPATHAATAQDVIRVAQSQVGYHEGRSGGHWNNDQKYSREVPGLAWSNWQPWCDTFVAWCFFKAGALSLLPEGPTASVAQSIARWKRAGRWSEYPAVGAQVCYGNGAHTGIVVRYDGQYIYTVEGNTNNTGSAEGDGVYERVRYRRSSYVTGYGYPAYPGGIASADPSWQDLVPIGGTGGAGGMGGGGPAPTPTPTAPKEWDEMATEKQIEDAAYRGAAKANHATNGSWNIKQTVGQWLPDAIVAKLLNYDGTSRSDRSLYSILLDAGLNATQNRDYLNQVIAAQAGLSAQIAGLTTALGQIAQGQQVDVDALAKQVQAAAEKGVADAIASIDVTVKTAPADTVPAPEGDPA